MHYQKHNNLGRNGSDARVSFLCAILPLLAAAPLTAAQSLDAGDVVIRHGLAGEIESGAQAEGGVEWGRRVFPGRLDLGQFANLADDPGFDSFSGAFPTGSVIGLDILAGLRLWNGEDFDSIDPDYAMSVTKGSLVITTPAADERVPGFGFGSADANGRFHHHVRFFLDPFDAVTDVPGLWMLTLELWSTNAAVLPSEPVYLVFASGSEAVEQQADAIAWVETNLVGGPCSPADLAEPEGILDLSDITAFASAFLVQDAAADLVEPFGVFDLSDITAFVTAFTAGCP